MITPTEIAEKFELIDIHDDLVEGFRFVPAAARRARAVIEITFCRKWTNQRRLVVFRGCRNFDVALDADVLSDNSPINSAAFEATTETKEIQALLQRHRKAWNVEYESRIDPFSRKQLEVHKLVLFRVRLFGGTLLILATNFSVRALRKTPRADD